MDCEDNVIDEDEGYDEWEEERLEEERQRITEHFEDWRVSDDWY